MQALSPAGLAKVERYLLPTERAVITVRRHWAVFAWSVVAAAVGLVVALLVETRLPPGLPVVRYPLWIAFSALVVRTAWTVVSWREDWFVVTDERLLLTYGLLTRRVAIMPLSKVTDLTYNVSLVGRLLGYGEFVFESAGQDQALHAVGFLPDSRGLFAVLSNELFGPHGVASTRRKRGVRPQGDSRGDD